MIEFRRQHAAEQSAIRAAEESAALEHIQQKIQCEKDVKAASAKYDTERRK